MRRVLIIGVLLLTVLTGEGVNANRQSVVYASGTVSCGRWLQRKETSDWRVPEHWVLGWVSSASYYSPRLKQTDADAIVAWVDNYCAANPLDNLYKAAQVLVQALRVK